jgi:hypothetical protein
MPNVDHSEFEVRGQNSTALFSLKIHRGEGMCLLAMNWKNGTPPQDFVGFAIEYREPGRRQVFSRSKTVSPLPEAPPAPACPRDFRRSRSSGGCIFREMRTFQASFRTALRRYL